MSIPVFRQIFNRFLHPRNIRILWNIWKWNWGPKSKKIEKKCYLSHQYINIWIKLSLSNCPSFCMGTKNSNLLWEVFIYLMLRKYHFQIFRKYFFSKYAVLIKHKHLKNFINKVNNNFLSCISIPFRNKLNIIIPYTFLWNGIQVINKHIEFLKVSFLDLPKIHNRHWTKFHGFVKANNRILHGCNKITRSPG